MKKYLIRVEMARNSACTTINGDNLRPFQVFNNLWNYTTPGHAARRLEKYAQQWEQLGFTVKRVYGTVFDMPTQGNEFNTECILLDYSKNANTEKYIELIRKHYHY
jgi:hypothetical protein